MIVIRIGIAVVVFVLVSCSSKPGVLEELEEGATSPVSAESSLEATDLKALLDLLDSHGYQGVGLQYESTDTIKLLTDVFSTPSAHGKKVQLVYTGLKMAYEGRYQSLTVNAKLGKDKILEFIRKSVPNSK